MSHLTTGSSRHSVNPSRRSSTFHLTVALRDGTPLRDTDGDAQVERAFGQLRKWFGPEPFAADTNLRSVYALVYGSNFQVAAFLNADRCLTWLEATAANPALKQWLNDALVSVRARIASGTVKVADVIAALESNFAFRNRHISFVVTTRNLSEELATDPQLITVATDRTGRTICVPRTALLRLVPSKARLTLVPVGPGHPRWTYWGGGDWGCGAQQAADAANARLFPVVAHVA